ncbi:hypothetical protein [Collinsella aerofaciens]|uniref:hypothetical protein n=1 Tax=Collinsella aerofaciens TaxID=74426 RepID=UPI001D016432|nr:hypothetical protein [Collinsella aerofaciens]MCB5367051.1 hypothetical protein [Collinsella aerofaciens]MCB5369089.1 hypothetical protein [Collinsella aerofaciens]
MDMMREHWNYLDKLKEVYNAFARVTKDYQSIYEDIYFGEGISVSDPKIYDKALNLYKSVGEFIEKLELSDENLDLKKSKLKDVDGLFSDHPVTTYVNTVIDYLTGKVGREKVQEATRQLVEFQQAETEEKKESLEEFVNRFVDDLNIEDKVYANNFKEALLKAIDTLENCPGHSKFLVFVGDAHLQGHLYVDEDHVTIKVEDKQYVFEKSKDEDAYEDEDEYDPEEIDDLDDMEYLYAKEADRQLEETSNTLLGHVRNFDSDDEKEINKLLDVIQYVLDLKTDFTQDDLELIRFYLKHLAFRGDIDIDSLSDRALVLAWKQHKYIRSL